MNQPISSQSSRDLGDQESKKKWQPRTCVVVSLKRTAGPSGATGDDWYRYEISNPGSPITGYRRGKKCDVLEYLDECIKQLNERLKSGTVIAWAPRGRKPKQAKSVS